MPTVRASCPDCGDVEFTTRDIKVSVSAPDGSGTYAFACPGCACTVVKAAEKRTIDLLLASGVMLVCNTPLEFHEPRFSRPLTHADIVSFASKLYDGMSLMDAFEALVEELKK